MSEVVASGQKVDLIPFGKSHLHYPDYHQWLLDYQVVRYIVRPELWSGISFSDLSAYVESLLADDLCSFLLFISPLKRLIGTAKLVATASDAAIAPV